MRRRLMITPVAKVYIVFADPEVERICAETWGDGVGLTMKEASAVTSNMDGIFIGNTDIVSFDELQYFTGITTALPAKGSSGRFRGCTSLVSIHFFPRLTKSGYDTFYGCSSLERIYFHNTIYTAGMYNLFSGCTNLKHVYFDTEAHFWGSTIGNYVASNRYHTFFNASKDGHLYIGDTEIINAVQPSNFTTLKSCFFIFCKSLETIQTTPNLTAIGEYAFYNCTALTTVNFMATSGFTVSKNAFTGCSNIEKANVPSLDTWVSISWSTNTSHVFSATSKGYLYANNVLVTHIDFPSTISSVSNYCCYNTKGLASVTLPNSYTSIGTYAFNGASDLTTINCPSSLETIGTYAFYNCSLLTGFDLSTNSTLTSIGSYAFAGCSSIQEMVIPEGVTTINERTFSNCTNLSSVTIPSSVTTINAYAFFNCGITGTFEVPSTVTTIANYAFQDLSKVTNLIFNKSVNSVVFAGFQNSSGAGWTGNGTGTLLIRGSLTETAQYYQRKSFKHYIITGDFTFTDSKAGFTSSSAIRSLRVGGNYTGPTSTGCIFGATNAGNRIEFIEVMGTVTGPFDGGSYHPKHSWILHLGYNGVATSTPSEVEANNSYLTTIYVGDGSSQDADQAILDLYLADANWASYTSKFDLWYNYNGEYKTTPIIPAV